MSRQSGGIVRSYDPGGKKNSHSHGDDKSIRSSDTGFEDVPADEISLSYSTNTAAEREGERSPTSTSSSPSSMLSPLNSLDLYQQPNDSVSLQSTDSNLSSLQDYFKKMGYTQEEFLTAIDEIKQKDPGVHLNPNVLLTHLVTKANKPSVKSLAVKPISQPRAATLSAADGDDPENKRSIVIDGSNVAMEHGNHRQFSCKGVKHAVEYFQKRGHKNIVVFVPIHRMGASSKRVVDQQVLRDLRDEGVLIKTPSRRAQPGNTSCYDDRFILKLAAKDESIVVSNDHFRDLAKESEFSETIERRILPFTFVGDKFMPAEDPLGKKGPTLDQFLRINPLSTSNDLCPYGRKCTYGTKCKYRHPEKERKTDSSLDSGVGADQSFVTTESDYTRKLAGLSIDGNKPARSGSRPTSLPVNYDRAAKQTQKQALPQQQQQRQQWSGRPEFDMSKPQPLPPHLYNAPTFHPTHMYYNQPMMAIHQPSFDPYDEHMMYQAHPNEYMVNSHYLPPHMHNYHQEVYYSLPETLPPYSLDELQPSMHRTNSDSRFNVCQESPVSENTQNVSPYSGQRGIVFKELINIFNADQVRRVMDANPEETDKKRLATAIVQGALE